MKNTRRHLSVLLPLVVALVAITFYFVQRSPQTPPTAGDPSSPAAGPAGSPMAQPLPGGSPAVLATVAPNPPGPQVAASAGGGATTMPRKRAWEPEFFANLRQVARGQSIRFELVGGEFAGAFVCHTEFRDGDLVYLAGEITTPESGRFFFQQQNAPGKAGAFAGVVEFPSSKRAFRLEPTGQNGAPELVERTLGEVICLALPPPQNEPDEIPPLDPSDHPDYPIPAYQDGIIPLQSLPGSSAVLYIDYRGGYTPTWGGITYERPNVSNAQIRDVWKRVAEDYQPFNVNVTTDIKVYQAAPETSRQRVVCTPTTTAAPGAGGVAYLNSWNWSGDTPCWSFYSTGKSAAEVISHEAGHTLQLGHDGRVTPSEGYYGGQGSGATGWAPIMGVGYYQPVAQWSKGEYTSANNTEDDLARIVGNNNSVDYRTDDTGNTLSTARYLEVYPDSTATAEGVIETTGDTDAFRFTTTGGAVSLRADPAPGEWADLAISATLFNANNQLVASNNPQSQLWASISTTLTNGTYTFRVTGAGRNNPLTDGFSSYASLGYYSISGTVAGGAQPTRFSLAENPASGTVVGTIPANNPDGNPLSYSIASGNAGAAFAVNNSGVLSVLNRNPLNYELLAATNQISVQYELFVNIVNTVNSALTETNRRVVVQILDVNEPPTLAPFTNSILAGTAIGATVGTVGATDPDYYTILNFNILSGNTSNFFSIGTESGTIAIASPIPNAAAGIYDLVIRAQDTGSPSTNSQNTVRVTVLTNATPFNLGTIRYATYDNIGSGNALTDLTGNSRFPTDPTADRPLASFEGETDRADNYGSVVRGYLVPPVSGSYTFWIASDDSSELRLSTTTNPASATVIASVSGATSPRQWTKFTSQQSAARGLVGGQAYYIEARQKEGGGGDNLAVAWRGPATANLTNVISGLYLAPYFQNYMPKASPATSYVRRDSFVSAPVGRLPVTDVNTNDAFTFSILSGNEENIFYVDTNGWVRVASEAALQATFSTSFFLQIKVTDSGNPPYSATNTVTLNLVEPPAITASGIQRELFQNIGSGNLVTDLTGNAKYPAGFDELEPLTSFASPVNVADNYGSRIRANLVAPVTGNYQFFISSDDYSQLKLSINTNPASAGVIASVSGYSPVNSWTNYASQMSGLRALVAGERYYLEALHKEGDGGDHVEVAWRLPGDTATNIIDGAYLEPVDLNFAPQFSAQTLSVFSTAPNGTAFGTITASDNAADQLTFKLLSGNTNNMFSLNPVTGELTLVDNTLFANGTLTNVVLAVAVQDSGLGGLYPLHSTQANITIRTATTNDPFVWYGGGADSQWSTVLNWGGLAPASGAKLIFGKPVRQSAVNNLAALSLGWVLVTNGGFNLTGNPITLQSGLTNSGNNTWAVPTLLGTFQTFASTAGELNLAGPLTNAGFNLNLVATGDIRLSTGIQGSGGLVKSGAGRVLMSGLQPYTGVTVVSATGNTGAALEVNGPDDLDLSASTVTMNGRLDLWNHNAVLGALAGNGTVFANNGSRTLTLGANHATSTFTGSISNSSWAAGATLALVKAGSGAQSLNGSGGYSGGTVVRSGTLNFAGNTSLGTGEIILGDPATGTNVTTLLATAGVTNTSPLTVSSNGAGAATIGTANISPGTANMLYSGTLTAQRDTALQAGSAVRTTFGGRISGSGGLRITSPFAATRVIAFDRPSGAANDFTGGLTIDTNAWLQIGVNNSIGNRTLPDSLVVNFAPNSRLRIAASGTGDGETVGALNSLFPGVGVVEMSAGTAFKLTLGSSNSSGFFSGFIANTSGSLSLAKTGSGTQFLSGGNSFSGLFAIGAGTVVAAGGSALGSASQGTVVSNTAVLALSNNITISGEALTLYGSGTGAGALRNDGGNNAYNGTITLANAVTLGSLAGSLTLGGTFNTANQTPTFFTEAGASLNVVSAFGGSGGLVKQGPGLLTISGAPTYAGATLLQGGTLALGPSGALGGTASLTLSPGATLDATAPAAGLVVGPSQTLRGNGTLLGNVTVNGLLSPGASIGTLAFSNHLALAGNTTMEISRSGTSRSNDVVLVAGTLTLGGTLTIVDLGPDAFQPGDAFPLFSATAFGSGVFTSFTLPSLPGNLAWDTSTLATDGTLRVALAEPAVPPTLSLQAGGSSLTLTWPSNYFSYTLQGQTNAPGAGLGAGWFAVPGISNNTFVIPLDPAAGSMFYRLFKP